MTTQQLREKIGAWLSDKTNHEGDLVDFLVDDCGVEYNPEWEEEDRPIEETNDSCKCCDIILTDDDMDRGTGECECCEEMMKDEELEKCEKCDIRLGLYDGKYEMKVEWFGKTMCGNCALTKAEYKLMK